MKNKPLLIIFLTVFIDLVGFGIIIPLNPYLTTQYGAGAFAVGLLMAIYSAMQFLFSPVWGGLSDKIGRRPIILMSLLGACIAHLMFAYANSFILLFLARTLAGIFGGNISTAMAYIADITEGKDRSKGMGLIGAAFGLGFIFGPLIGSVFAKVGSDLGNVPPLGPSFAAVIASVICFINFLMACFFLKESLSEEDRKKSKERPSRIKNIAKYIRTPVIGPLIATFFLSSLAMAHMEASLFLFVKDIFNWPLEKAGMGFAYVGLVMVFTQGYLIRKLIPKLGEKKTLLLGLGLGAIGLASIGGSFHIALLAVAVTLLGLGSGMVNPSITGSISRLSDSSEQGSILGVTQSFSALGRIIGPAVGGYFYQYMGKSSPFIIAGLLMGSGFLIIYMIRKHLENDLGKN